MNIGSQLQEKREAILATAVKYGAHNIVFGVPWHGVKPVQRAMGSF
ncbi:hypothetical protein ACN4EG_26520 [Alkalinema pantanalense CENA528]